MRAIPFLLLLLFIPFLFQACHKAGQDDPIPPPVPAATDFTKYTIRKGQQYCDQNSLVLGSWEKLKFRFRFDSSARYQTKDPSNQEDVNKLIGFSDNNQQHHQYSARFGWNWSRDSLRLYAYVYNNSVFTFKEISALAIDREYTASIQVEAGDYRFTLGQILVSLPRESKTKKAEGYKLFPYFGGDEAAPHDISIWIKEE